MDQNSSSSETRSTSMLDSHEENEAEPTAALLACRLILERSQSMDDNEIASLAPGAYDLEPGNVQRQEQAYFNMFVRFFWSTIVPDRYRLYFAAHPTIAAIVVFLAFGSIGLALFYTGNLVVLGIYVKLVFCFLFGGDEGDGGTFRFCWA